MATRLYSSADAPPISPAFDAGWEATGLAARILGITNAAAFVPAAAATSGLSANADTLGVQLLYGPLAPQLIAGTIKGQLACREVNAAADARAQLTARILSADGATVRGVLLAMDTAALSSEFAVTGSGAGAVNRRFPRGGAVALTSQASLAGDWLCVEWGFRQHAADTGVIRVSSGSASATDDFPEDESTVIGTQYRGWIELSQTLILAPGPRAFSAVI